MITIFDKRCFLSEDNRYVYCGTYLFPVVLVLLSSTIVFLWLMRYVVCCGDRCCPDRGMKKSPQYAIGISQVFSITYYIYFVVVIVDVFVVIFIVILFCLNVIANNLINLKLIRIY